MSTETATVDANGNAVVTHDAHHGPTDKIFVAMALKLAVITAVEVAWSYLPVWEDASGLTSAAEIGGLLLMMALKFVMIAGTFMHLKFDNRVLTRVFYAGLVLAIGVYIAVLASFEVFGG